jgi:Cu/Ag efflux protein CusF
LPPTPRTFAATSGVRRPHAAAAIAQALNLPSWSAIHRAERVGTSVATWAAGGRMHPISVMCLSVMLVASGSPQKTVSKSDVMTATATVQAIDSTNRVITLRSEDGTEDTMYVPNDVTRFDQVKVGDKLKVRYHESMVFQLRKPGEASNKPGDTAAASRTPGAKPGAQMSRQVNATVDVVAVDPAVPSITVKTADGRTVTRKIENKKNLEGVKAGDKIDITFTQAALIAIEPATGK